MYGKDGLAKNSFHFALSKIPEALKNKKYHNHKMTTINKNGMKKNNKIITHLKDFGGACTRR